MPVPRRSYSLISIQNWSLNTRRLLLGHSRSERNILHYPMLLLLLLLLLLMMPQSLDGGISWRVIFDVI